MRTRSRATEAQSEPPHRVSPPQGTQSPGVPPDATEMLPGEGGSEMGTPGSPFLTLLPNSPILQTERLRAREGE